ncbi:MAG TPA: MFS transporter, partial [Nitriliruptorales bacterium]
MRQASADVTTGGGRVQAPPRTLPLLLAPMSGILLVALGQSVLTTALPTVVGELGALRHLPWVVAAGLVATAASVPLFGRLSDDLGRRRVFRAAIITFIIGTLASGAAQTLPQLLIARVVQGIGGGGLITLPHAIVADVFSPRERGRYLGYTVSMHVLASVLGPLVGGLLVDHVSWRVALAAPAPVGIYALMVSVRVPDQRSGREGRASLTSASLLATGVVSLMLAVLAGGALGWTSSPMLLAGAVAAASMAAYVAHARRSADAVIPPGLLRNPTVAVTTAVGLLLGMSLHGSLAFLPVFFQV